MAKLTTEQLEYVAELSKIWIDSDKLRLTVQEVGSIVDFVDQLQSTETDGTEPISQVTGLTDVWREDIVADCQISRDDLLANAPRSQDGYIVVKKVL